MRLFYKDSDISDFAIEIDKDGGQIRMPLPEAEMLVTDGEAVIYDTIDDLYEVIQYRIDRSKVYPSIQDQLDLLYHEIIVSGSLTSSGSWAESIRAVKDAHPKP